MAKQLVNPLERHVEKGVLGLAVLLLLGVAAKFLVTSPNQIELGGETVAPNTIDQLLLQTASKTRERIRSARSETQDVTELAGDFAQALDPFAAHRIARKLKRTVSFRPTVPRIDPPEGGFGGAALAEVVSFVKNPPISVFAGRSTYELGEEGERVAAANWVMISAMFHVKAQSAELRSKYGASRTDVLFGRPQLQRRMQGNDGTWPEEWEFVEPYYGGGIRRLPPLPVIQLVEDGNGVSATRTSATLVKQFKRVVSDGLIQVELLRPTLPELLNGDTWAMPILTSRLDVLMQDDFYMYPKQPPAAEPGDRYPDSSNAGRGSTETVTAEEQIVQDLESARLLLAAAVKNDSENDATRAFNKAQEVAKNPSAKDTDKTKARKLMTSADIARQTIRRRNKRRGGQVKDPNAVERDFVREPPTRQQIWVYDAIPGSVQSNRRYQYRLRPVIFNALAGQPEKFRDPLDAAKIFLEGSWSDPIEISIDEDATFFAIGDDRRKQAISLEFFRWFEGDWVRTKTRVKLRVGELMFAEQKTIVRDMDDRNLSATAEVEFTASATVIDVDFSYPYRERKKVGRFGIRFGDSQEGTALVFVDADGRLHERLVKTDKLNPELKQRRAQVYTGK